MGVLKKIIDRTTLQRNGCMIWNGALGGNRLYGYISIKGKVERVHRVVYRETHHGNIDNLCILHTCDTPSCVNPDHLFAGTRQDNMDDMLSKDRLGKNARYSRYDILEIRQLSADGVETRIIAETFGTTTRYINKILSREIWKHVSLRQC